MSATELKVALVGCGQIADAHLQEICKIRGARLVATCDRHAEMARQAADRFGVPRAFDDLDRMLEQARPDVVHVTTPPHMHRPIALPALAAGCHVYVEKPFAVDADEADEILRAARLHHRLVCVGHDQLFDPAWQECREMYERGELGRIVHIDAVQGYDLKGPFGTALSNEPDHWVHRLPGGFFQNTISHALYKITDFLADEQPAVWATWFGPPPAGSFPTELRVILRGEQVTGHLLFTSLARPVQRVVRVYGTRQCVEVDFDARLLRRLTVASLPGPFAKIAVPARQVKEAARSLLRNLWKFLKADLHYFAGMKSLFERYYRAIREGGPSPIPPGEIRRVTAIMDDIFRHCRAQTEPPVRFLVNGKRDQGHGRRPVAACRN
jgi:predicted dehydrogenase